MRRRRFFFAAAQVLRDSGLRGFFPGRKFRADARALDGNESFLAPRIVHCGGCEKNDPGICALDFYGPARGGLAFPELENNYRLLRLNVGQRLG